MALTQEQLQRLQEEEQRAQGWHGNVKGKQSSETVSTSQNAASTTVTEQREPQSSETVQSTRLSQDAINAGDKAFTQSMNESGYVYDLGKGWIEKNPSISSLIDMRRINEEAEEVNRKKARAAGLHSALTILGDMFTAGAGGNVTARNKNTIAEDAAKDTTARRDAMAALEKAEDESARKRLTDSIASANAAREKTQTLLADKVSTSTQSGGNVQRITTAEPSRSTQTTTRSETPDAKKTVKMPVYNAAGVAVDYNVDATAAAEYMSDVATYLNSAAMVTGSELQTALINANLWDVTNGKPKAKAIETIIDNGTYYQFISPELKKKNQDLYFNSLEWNGYLLSDEYRRMSQEERVAELERRKGVVQGEQPASVPYTPSRTPRGGA